MIATKCINNTLEQHVCENEFVRYYLHVLSLSFESPRYQQCNQRNKSNKAIRDGKYLTPPHASAW